MLATRICHKFSVTRLSKLLIIIIIIIPAGGKRTIVPHKIGLCPNSIINTGIYLFGIQQSTFLKLCELYFPIFLKAAQTNASPASRDARAPADTRSVMSTTTKPRREQTFMPIREGRGRTKTPRGPTTTKGLLQLHQNLRKSWRPWGYHQRGNRHRRPLWKGRAPKRNGQMERKNGT